MSGITTATNILGSYEQEQAAAASSGTSSELGKDAFLQLLVTQLENQDPLEPMDDTEFVSQLAEFSNLEQLTDISDGVGTLVENTGQDMLSGVNYIGKGVISSGSTISKSGDQVSPLYYTTDNQATNVTVNIFDGSGNMVDSQELGAQQAGTYAFNWDGTDYDETSMADGNYSVTFAAEGSNGAPVLVSTEVAGIVNSVESVNGNTMLNLSDGRSVNILDVSEVAMVDTSSSSESDSDG